MHAESIMVSVKNGSEYRDHLRDCLILGLIYLVEVGIKLWWVHNTTSPLLFADEQWYKDLSEALFMGKGYFAYGVNYASYPPLYPIATALSFLSRDHWYQWMLNINVLISSTIIFPVWSIARWLLPKRESWFCVLIAAILPFHVIFPRMIMSENLFVPLFLGGVYWLLPDNTQTSPVRQFTAGIVWGFCLLTRHLFLVALPVLFLAWWVRPWIVGTGSFPGLFRRRRLTGLGFLLAGVLLVYSPWLLYFVVHGAPLAKAIGIGIAASQLQPRVFDHEALMKALLPWVAVYGALLVLASAPYLHYVLAYPLVPSRARERRSLFFLLLIIGLTGVFAVSATAFLWRFFGNKWAGSYTEERYVTYAIPLLPILGLLVLGRLNSAPFKTRWRAVLLSSAASGLLLYGAYALIIGRTLWPLAPRSPIMSMYSSAFALCGSFHAPIGPFSNRLLAVYFLVLISQGIAVLVVRRYQALVFLVGLAAFYAFSDVHLGTVIEWMQVHNGHGRALASFLLKNNRTDPDSVPVRVLLDPNLSISAASMQNLTHFWGIPWGSLDISVYDTHASKPQAGFLMTGGDYANPLFTYQLAGTAYHVYDLTAQLHAPPLSIVAFGPSEIQAGQGFNAQPNGDSAMWFKTRNATANTTVVFNGREMVTDFGGPELLTITVPREYYETPGIYHVYLFDPIIQGKSNEVEFVVKSARDLKYK